MLIKLILLGFVIWFILTSLKKYQRSIEANKPSEPEAQDMVRCALCGTHVPKSECIEHDGKQYCCIEHSQKNP